MVYFEIITPTNVRDICVSIKYSQSSAITLVAASSRILVRASIRTSIRNEVTGFYVNFSSTCSFRDAKELISCEDVLQTFHNKFKFDFIILLHHKALFCCTFTTILVNFKPYDLEFTFINTKAKMTSRRRPSVHSKSSNGLFYEMYELITRTLHWAIQ